MRPGSFAGGPALLGDGSALLAWGDVDRVRVVAGPATGPLAGTPELDRPGIYPRIAAAGSRAVVVWNVATGAATSRSSPPAATRRPSRGYRRQRMAQIFVTRRLPGAALDRLAAAGHEVIVHPGELPPTARSLRPASRPPTASCAC